jgi:hypothetical protein
MSIADRIFEDGIMEDENSRTDLNFGDRYYRGDDEQYCYNKTEDKFETINEKNEKMGRMKEEFMKEREETINAMHDIAQQPSINQLNNKMTKKTMQEKLKKQPEPIVETRKEALRRLYKENGLVEEDIYKDKRGFVIITRTGIDKIVSRNNITVAYEVINMDIEKGICVLRAAASMKVGNDVKNAMSFGEASNNNLMGGGKKFPVSMAEKRAMSRVVLKIAGFYEQGVFGQDEIVD